MKIFPSTIFSLSITVSPGDSGILPLLKHILYESLGGKKN
jgi:hypothetical protein